MKKLNLNSNYLPLLITVGLFISLFLIGSIAYNGFFSMQIFLNLFVDNAFLIIAALGETLVIISGGVDLSIGSIIALTCMLSAYMLTVLHMNSIIVILIVLAIGALFGVAQGYLIAYKNFQPFIGTLVGMFIARGFCYIISQDTIAIEDPLFIGISTFKIRLFGDTFITLSVVIALIILGIYIYISQYTKFGRNIYSIGGNEQSAKLMGLPVNMTKLLVYTLSGLTSAIAGLVFSFYMLSGYGLHGVGLEMNAIAAAVIGGTLMTGGVGLVIGTVFGVLIEGIMQTIITFQGNLNSWWTNIAIAMLLLLFIVMQRLFSIRRESRKSIRSVEVIEDN